MDGRASEGSLLPVLGTQSIFPEVAILVTKELRVVLEVKHIN